MAVSDKWSSHITYYKCHNSHHYPNSAYSFSHPSTLKYLRSTQTDKERPQSMIKDMRNSLILMSHYIAEEQNLPANLQ